MKTKTCTGCGKRKLISSFHPHKSRGYQHLCKDCSSEKDKQRYLANKKSYAERNKANRESLRELHKELKRSNPCIDCGKHFHPCQMEYDHLEDKKFTIASLINTGRRTKFLAEIEKCELVCALCHRERTYRRKHGSAGHR